MAQEKANNDQQQASKANAEREKDDSVQLKKEDGQNQVIDSKKSELTPSNSFPAQFKSLDISSEGGQKSLSANFAPIQRKENKTGLPNNLKSGMENLSGHSMDDVRVHRNSDKPAQLNAHAYAQGTDIHLGPGQEKHLPHELGHVVQQKEGRVKPTKQMKGKVAVNDDAGLEKEADVLGDKALNIRLANNSVAQTKLSKRVAVAQFEGKIDDTKDASDVVKLATNENVVAPLADSIGTEIGFADAIKDTHDFIESAQDLKGDLSSFSKWTSASGALGKAAMNAMGKIQALAGKIKGVEPSKTAAPGWVPGLGAIFAGIKNAGDMMQNDEKFSKAKELGTSAITDEEKETIKKYLSRLNWQLVELGVDLTLNIAEAITAFVPPPANSIVQTVHAVVDVFKFVGKKYHSYLVSNEQQADARVDMDADSMTKKQLGSLDNIISNDPESVYALVKLKEEKENIKLVLKDYPENEESKKDKNKLIARQDHLTAAVNRAIRVYNYAFGGVDKKISEDDIGNILNIHKNVAKKILEQAAQEKSVTRRIRSFFHAEIKENILSEVFAGNVPDQIYLADLEKAKDPQYFWLKTQTAIKLSANRKRFGNDEITDKLKDVLVARQSQYFDKLQEHDPETFSAAAKTNAATYAAAVESYMSKMSL